MLAESFLEKCPLFLGNSNAKEYVEGMWKMLQLDTPEDFVLATGKTATVRDFAQIAFACAGIELEWRGVPGSVEEVGICKRTEKTLIEIDPRYFRPSEVDFLVGDPSKALEKLDWKARTSLEELVEIMVKADLDRLIS